MSPAPKSVSKRRKAEKIAIAPESSWWRGADWPIIVLLAIATIAVFSRSIFSEFVHWDDNLNVWQNPSLNPPTMEKMAHFWKSSFLNLYIPLTYSVWGVLAAVARNSTPDSHGIWLNPYVFHAANLLIHLWAVMVIYALIKRLVGAQWPAAVGALLFAIHPLQVEPVAWVTGMKDLLCGALSLAALWQYVAYAQAEKGGVSRAIYAGHYLAALLLFILALLSKPSAVTVPPIAFILDAWVIGRSYKKTILALLPMLIFVPAVVVVSMKVQAISKPVDAGHALLRPLIAADALAFYFYKLIAPWRLGVHYDRGPLTVINAGWIYYTWVAPAAALAVAIGFRRRVPILLPALAIFVVSLGPVLGLVPFAFQRFSTVADRYVYVAMLGPALAVAAALTLWNAKRPIPPAAMVIIAILLVSFGVRSFMQASVWHDNATLFHSALATNPRSALAFNQLASELANEPVRQESAGQKFDRLEQAKAMADKAIQFDPQSPDGYLARGSFNNMEGNLLGAVADFRKAYELEPDSAETLDSLGGALAAQGSADVRHSASRSQGIAEIAEAEQFLRRAIKADSTLAKAHLNLGTLLPTIAKVQSNLGNINPQQMQLIQDEAFREMQKAVELNPGDPVGQMNLALMLLNRQQFREAMEHIKAVMQLDPNFPGVSDLYRKVLPYTPGE